PSMPSAPAADTAPASAPPATPAIGADTSGTRSPHARVSSVVSIASASVLPCGHQKIANGGSGWLWWLGFRRVSRLRARSARAPGSRGDAQLGEDLVERRKVGD